MALGISEAVSLSGRVVELVKAGATIELQERITELREAVLNAKEEILSLRAELGELKRAAEEREQVTFDGVAYWQQVPGSEKQGPFCHRCYDADSKLVRLQHFPASLSWKWSCVVCNKSYRDPPNHARASLA